MTSPTSRVMNLSVRRVLGPVVPLVLILGVVVLQHLAGPQHGQPGYTGFITSPGVMLQGADRGLIIALLAVGMTLIYRTNNIINFAQSEIGFRGRNAREPAHPRHGLELLPRRDHRATRGGLRRSHARVRVHPPLPELTAADPTVATTGIQQLLVAAALGLNVAFGTGTATFFKPPITASFAVGQTNFAGDDVLIIIVAPIVLIALAFFLRFGAFGKAIRASAERSDHASLLGIPVRRIHSMVWIISAVLSYIAMMLYIGNAGLPRGYPLGAEILLMTLSAAVIGRFDHMPTIVLTSIGMGILDASIRYEWPDPSQRDFGIALVAIVAVLVVRQARGTRAGVVSSWQDSREVRPIPNELRNVPEVKWTRIGLMVALGTFVIAIPFWFSDSKLILATSIVIYSIVAVSLVVLTGWAGQVSLGHLALVAFGGAAAGTMTTRYHWDLSLALLMAAAVSVIMLLLVGLPTIPRGRLALGITTLALMLAAPYLLTANLAPWFLKDKLPLFEGNATRFRPHLFGRITLDSDVRYYFFCLIMLAAAIAAAKGLRHARTRPRAHRPARERAQRPSVRHRFIVGLRHRARRIGHHGRRRRRADGHPVAQLLHLERVQLLPRARDLHDRGARRSRLDRRWHRRRGVHPRHQLLRARVGRMGEVPRERARRAARLDAAAGWPRRRRRRPARCGSALGGPTKKHPRAVAARRHACGRNRRQRRRTRSDGASRSRWSAAVILSAREERRRSDFVRASGASLRRPWGREPQASGGGVA